MLPFKPALFQPKCSCVSRGVVDEVSLPLKLAVFQPKCTCVSRDIGDEVFRVGSKC